MSKETKYVYHPTKLLQLTSAFQKSLYKERTLRITVSIVISNNLRFSLEDSITDRDVKSMIAAEELKG